jgi:hypothetical protein
MFGSDGDADRAADRDRRALDEIRLRQRGDHRVSQLAKRVAIALARQHHLELVATEPADQPGIADRALQSLGDLFEQGVADLMAERVVDRLEPVEVEQEQPRRPTRALLRCQRAVERQPHPLTVGKAGEAVEQREARDLRIRATLFGKVAARADEPLEPAEIIEHRAARNRPPPFRGAVDRGAHRIVGERGARRQVKGQRPLRVRHGAVDAEDVGQPLAHRVGAHGADLPRDLGGEVGDVALAVGLPEPAGAVRFEFADQPRGEAPGAFGGDAGGEQRQVGAGDAGDAQGKQHHQHQCDGGGDAEAGVDHHHQAERGGKGERRGAHRMHRHHGDDQRAADRHEPAQPQRPQRQPFGGGKQQRQRHGSDRGRGGEDADTLVRRPAAHHRQPHEHCAKDADHHCGQAAQDHRNCQRSAGRGSAKPGHHARRQQQHRQRHRPQRRRFVEPRLARLDHMIVFRRGDAERVAQGDRAGVGAGTGALGKTHGRPIRESCSHRVACDA